MTSFEMKHAQWDRNRLKQTEKGEKKDFWNTKREQRMLNVVRKREGGEGEHT